MRETVKVVRRPVYDDLVKEKTSSADEFKDYLESLEVYQKDVITTLPRVELNKSSAGLIYKDAVSHFKVVLSQLMAESKDTTPGMINYYSKGILARRCPATVREIKVLKALAIDQISYSVEYANTIGYVFMLLFKDLIANAKTHEWKPDVNFNKMQEVVFESVTKHIDDFLAKEA